MPLIAGWLDKKGHLVKNWKKRYVLIEGNELSYYTDENLSNKKGSIQLDQSTKVMIRDGRTHAWKFKIMTQGKSLELSAISDNDRNFWVSTIRELIHPHDGKRRTASVSSTISVYTTNDSDESEENSDDEDDEGDDIDGNDKDGNDKDNDNDEIDVNGKCEVAKQDIPEVVAEEDHSNLPDIPLDLLPDLDDLIGK